MSIQELGIPIQDVDVIFQKHEGQLSTTLRYDRFRIAENPDQWRFLLGPDVVLLTHPQVVAQIAEDFVAYEGITLSDEEKVLFSIAPWIHDLGELIIEGDGIGDISFDQKTDAHEIKEFAVFNTVLNAIPEGDKKEIIKRSYQEIVMNRDSRLGRMFNAVERIGYLQTAIRAYTGIEGQRIQNWKGLVANVLSNQIIPLLNYCTEFPYATYILFGHRATIDAMFKETEGEVPSDNTGKPSYESGKLQKANLAWKSLTS